MYRSRIGKLQYVVYSRLDIAFVVGIVAKFSINPKENHLMVVKRIMRYLIGIEDYGLYYKKNDKFELRAYTDVDWAGNIDDQKKYKWWRIFLRKKIGHLDQ